MTGEKPADEPVSGGSFFGRRKGKALRAGQDRLVRELLPRLQVELPGDGTTLDPRSLFDAPVEACRIEIGFGGGEHLLDAARNAPKIGFIGCEPFVNGMAKLLAVIEAEGIANIRVFDRDATGLLARLAPGSLERADLLFPDPWPKRRQRKRRFVSDENLAALARVIRPGGVFRFASDIDDYVGWTLARILRSPDFDWRPHGPDDWRLPWAGWPGTRYEAKAKREGRRASYLTFARR
ncbi:tRNA (guanine(46)-N(7))-methyltransferase TrmB [Enterovirga rhinocerotis]|uniref:tRNA (guanine-N(7)-)-methyltransferase n=1 Tax=Enterovirga rhinocerotis TaxID=1339210 RepID=A0A4R7BPT3_9HYPH|nr:tRNA (guanine(46)-N(7))-methyltransferase TrmB [Enterovirga rhinocerotis]TDR87153.1 tRNA (guanine-N7-)-methyltransferase [Enterovirga rhinocerotis]